MGSALSYGRDEDTARISQHHLRDILQQLEAARKYDSLYLLAHSMGTRILIDALRGLGDIGAKVAAATRSPSIVAMSRWMADS